MAKFKLEDGTEIEAFTPEEMKAAVETETAGLKAKVDQLLDENKPLARKAKELEDAAAEAEQERLKEKEEFKTLWEKEQLSKKELQEKYETFSKQVQTKDVALAATEIASSLTRDTKRAELLKEQIGKFAKYTEGGVRFEMGGVEVPREKIVGHITENYAFLVDGSQASGGGAEGGKGSGATGDKTTTRSEFEAMDHGKRAEFAKSGGKVTDDWS